MAESPGGTGLRLTLDQRAALQWNAEALWATAAKGDARLRSTLAQFSLPRWRYLNQTPETVALLREMVRRHLPATEVDVRGSGGTTTRQQLEAKLDGLSRG